MGRVAVDGAAIFVLPSDNQRLENMRHRYSACWHSVAMYIAADAEITAVRITLWSAVLPCSWSQSPCAALKAFHVCSLYSHLHHTDAGDAARTGGTDITSRSPSPVAIDFECCERWRRLRRWYTMSSRSLRG